jgi:hypothetical protein
MIRQPSTIRSPDAGFSLFLELAIIFLCHAILVVRQNSIGLKVIDYSTGSLQTSNPDRDITVAGNSD